MHRRPCLRMYPPLSVRSLTRASIDPERFSAFAAAFAEGDAPEKWAHYTSDLFSPISDLDRVLVALTERQGERCRSGSTPSGKTTSPVCAPSRRHRP